MTLTPAGRYVVTCVILSGLLFIIGVAGRVIVGMWDAEQVIAGAVAAPILALLLTMLWRWE